MSTTVHDFAQWYDSIIFDPELRGYYGECGYYNAGYWAPGVATPKQAGDALIGRLLHSAPLTAARILDVACGLGETTRQIRESRPAAEVIGINISASQLRVCRKIGRRSDFVQMDACKLAFADSILDVIVSVEAAFHFKTRRDFLAEAARVLKQGGLLSLSDILFISPSLAGACGVPLENLIFDPDDYRRAVIESGFSEVEIEDCSQQCWTAFCGSFENWLVEERQRGGMTPERFESRLGLVSRLQSEVGHYLLVTARR